MMAVKPMLMEGDKNQGENTSRSNQEKTPAINKAQTLKNSSKLKLDKFHTTETGNDKPHDHMRSI